MFLKRFFRPIDAAPAPRPEIPEGQRVYAIGDIHGRLDLLDRLLGQIADDAAARGPAETTIIFLGDLIDRGPDSAGVVARALQLKESGADVRFIMGNHEEAMLAALDGRDSALKFFARIGGQETILSYGVSDQEYLDADYPGLLEMMRARMPEAHRRFIEGFEDMIGIGDYLFVHAGIRPGVPLAEQQATDLRWIREPFLEHRETHGRMVVHGHTITREVDERPNRIGIDTGAYFSDRLTALGLQGAERWLLDTAPEAGGGEAMPGKYLVP